MAEKESTDVGTPFKKGDVEGGPAKNRGCTDIICLLIFLCAQGGYVFVTMMGVSDGEPSKLYRQRDFRGEYCGIEENWNNGLNLKSQEKLTYMMNVSTSAELVLKQFVCSTVVTNELQNLWGASSLQFEDYMCACCKSPCASCIGSYEFDDVTNLDFSSITSKMTALTNPANGDLFSPTGANGNAFANVFDEVTKYFVTVCTSSCGAIQVAANRTYSYMPDANDPLYLAYWTLKQGGSGISSAITNTINNDFKFQALPLSVCPYEEKYCVPFPGLEFDEVPGNLCLFKLAGAAVNAVGDVAAEAFTSVGADRITEAMSETVGSWTGDFVDTIDAFILVGVSSFIIGMVFLVLLRFFVGCVVWLAIFVVFLLLLAGGALCYIRHTQCEGAGLLDTGKNIGVSTALAAHNAVSGGSGADESMSGNGADYRGVQTRTRSGRLCQDWNSNTPHPNSYTNTSYPNSDLNGNYCRNPSGAQSIWCYTVAADKTWELCTPIGVINAECTQGYAVESETMRKVLEILAFVIWGICILWVILVFCMCRQIMLAIAVNKVAAMFTAENPPVLFVLPFTQIVIAILWCLAWAVSAAFLLSQVPDDQVPTTYYATYAEAYGTDDTPGKCTDAFVNGDVYKYPGDLTATNDPCTGNLGDISGITPRCWACFPPRFVIDWRFAISFFVYLWNSAFLIAVGQFIVASACCVWFFAPSGEKRKQRPLRTGVWHCFRYHLGSLAFGAFLIALVQFIRYTLMYFEKQAQAAKNKLAVIVLKIVQCCLWCLEKCIKFLNKNAYIQIALMGKGFCQSAKNAVMLILRNMGRFGWVTLLSGVANFIGVTFILVATAVAGFFILKAMHPEVTPVMPMVVYVCMGYMVAKLFMNVFHLSCGTVLQCFLATEEMSKGDPSFDKSFVPGPMQSFVKGMTGGKEDGKEDS